ncbi:peptidase M28-like protein [Dysgonomonas alginatilytica]|uniref:Peptidase M28-like protein n=1 Tax=Dysgonomonas alginatilytica TaxID=1605892 RepID=A0A2V3PN90_9BACT|nr:M20/M25/M40 family metallo-hydrolase [Dysgonomonas alginatilytica]PXV62500.1 peptidase M28-like protein [Dysgonomonas alginatilytica]
MKIYLSVLLLSVSLLSAFAQKPIEKGLNSISERGAKAAVGFLASDALQGRGAGALGGQVASEYLASYLTALGIQSLSETYFQPFEAYSEDFKQKKRYQVNPDSIAKYKQGVHRVLNLRNVLGMIPGVNKNEYVIVGAHFDHLGMDTNLVGDQIYNGADDNASGVSAVMQIAKAFVESGVQPQRNVIFAFWDGEEDGLLGSKYFTQNCTFINQVKGYLNFDMIGRNNDEANPSYVVYFYTEANPAFGKWLKDDIKKYDLQLTPNYTPWDKPVGGSDNGSFAKAGVPIIWYHTDGHPDYHKPSDEFSKINWGKLVEITKASYLNAWNLANEKEY